MATQYVVPTGPITLVAATIKGCIEFPTSATAGATIIGVDFTFSASSLGSAVVEWGTYTTTGTGTTVTPAKLGTGQGVAANVGTVKVNHSAAPAGFAAAGLPSWVIPLPGMYSMAFPLGREMFQPASILRTIRCTSTVACTARFDLFFEQ